MRKTLTIMTLVMALALTTMAGAFADGHLPSTNDDNRTKEWAHFNVLDTRVGEVDVEFVSTRDFFSCFEYRSDGDTDSKIDDDNFNPAVDDGLYPFTCVKNETTPMTLTADEYVEIRMVFGAESDERFDWTRVDVLQPTVDDCKDGGWMTFGDFKNQGQCIASFKANENAGK
jgi:hypothetical protein